MILYKKRGELQEETSNASTILIARACCGMREKARLPSGATHD